MSKPDSANVFQPLRLGRRTLILGTAGAVATLLLPVLSGCAAPTAQTQTPEPLQTLRVKAFPGAQGLALFTALDEGFFARQHLHVQLEYTANSTQLREELAAGAIDIAHAAVDNAVALHEAGTPIVIVMGGDNSMNELFVQPDITSFANLRGKTLIVDSPHTAYALQARQILKDHGLSEGEYVIKPVGGTAQRFQAMLSERSNSASMLHLPFSIQAHEKGLRSLGRVSDLLGPYQASGVFTRRDWANTHPDALERYLTALIQALRWARAPENRQASIQRLSEHLKLTPNMAEQAYALLMDPNDGLAVDGRFDRPGFARLLQIRADLSGAWNGAPPPQERFVDLRWYQGALAKL